MRSPSCGKDGPLFREVGVDALDPMRHIGELMHSIGSRCRTHQHASITFLRHVAASLPGQLYAVTGLVNL
jgi:hypothetical protein